MLVPGRAQCALARYLGVLKGLGYELDSEPLQLLEEMANKYANQYGPKDRELFSLEEPPNGH